MQRHRFDPISSALGVIAVIAGLLVAFDAVEPSNAGWWLTVAALVVGLTLIPWGRPRHDESAR